MGQTMHFSPRESQIIQILLNHPDPSTKKISRALGIREGTVKCHMSHIFMKLGVHNRVAAVARLLRNQYDIQGHLASVIPLHRMRKTL
jgi:DNA-binding CsgD family transcriptional regulator